MEIAMMQKNQSILETVNRFGNRLMGFIKTRVPSLEDAQDVIQDVWYRLSDLEDIQTVENIGAWLFRVAKNNITDRFRKTKTDSIEDFSFFSEDGEVFFKQILLEDSQTPEQEYLKNMFWEELNIALSELPEKQRYVFVMNELEDISLQEIANQTGENIKTIISRKGYAVKYLREKMKDLYSDFFGS